MFQSNIITTKIVYKCMESEKIEKKIEEKIEDIKEENTKKKRKIRITCDDKVIIEYEKDTIENQILYTEDMIRSFKNYYNNSTCNTQELYSRIIKALKKKLEKLNKETKNSQEIDFARIKELKGEVKILTSRELQKSNKETKNSQEINFEKTIEDLETEVKFLNLRITSIKKTPIIPYLIDIPDYIKKEEIRFLINQLNNLELKTNELKKTEEIYEKRIGDLETKIKGLKKEIEPNKGDFNKEITTDKERFLDYKN